MYTEYMISFLNFLSYCIITTEHHKVLRCLWKKSRKFIKDEKIRSNKDLRCYQNVIWILNNAMPARKFPSYFMIEYFRLEKGWGFLTWCMFETRKYNLKVRGDLKYQTKIYLTISCESRETVHGHKEWKLKINRSNMNEYQLDKMRYNELK